MTDVENNSFFLATLGAVHGEQSTNLSCYLYLNDDWPHEQAAVSLVSFEYLPDVVSDLAHCDKPTCLAWNSTVEDGAEAIVNLKDGEHEAAQPVGLIYGPVSLSMEIYLEITCSARVHFKHWQHHFKIYAGRCCS